METGLEVIEDEVIEDEVIGDEVIEVRWRVCHGIQYDGKPEASMS